MNPSDRELLTRYRNGNAPDAFAELVKRHVDFVYSAARRQVHDQHLAEDVTQNVFLLLLKKEPRLEGHENLGGWLFQAAMFEARNALRTRRREAARVNKLAMNQPEQKSEMDAHIWNEVEPHVNEALEALNEAEREAVVLRYFQRHPYDRVAAALGVSEAAARQRVHRGLERMREFLTKRGVVAEAVALSAAIRLHGATSAPAELAVNTIAAAGRLQAALIAGKGAVGILASLQSKVIAAMLLLASAGVAVSVAVITARRHRAAETMYVDPGPANVQNALKRGPKAANPVIRPPFEFVRAASFDDHKGTREVGGFLGYINKGDWLRFNNVDLGPAGAQRVMFGAMIDCPEKYAGNKIVVHQDSLEGPVIATLAVQSTGGYGHWQAQFTPIATSTRGIHDVYLQFSGGGWNLDGFRILLTSRPGTDPIPAVSFNEAKGVQTRAGIVGEISDGFWVRYDGLDMGSGVNTVAITYSCDDAHAGGKINIKLDGPDGKLLGQMPIESTGSWGAYATHTVSIDPLSGSHTVTLTFSGKWHGFANVLTLQFFQISAPTSRPATRPTIFAW